MRPFCTLVLPRPPAGGDDLQGVKAGIMEIADIVAVTKDDGTTTSAASHALGDVRRAIRGGSVFRKKYGKDWMPKSLKCSAHKDPDSVKRVWDAALDFRQAIGGGATDDAGNLLPLSGKLLRRRRDQRVASTWDLARRDVLHAFATHPDVKALFETHVKDDLDGATATPRDAARSLVDAFFAAGAQRGRP